MTEFLNRFGLKELFGYLCPGALLLTCLFLWIPPKDVFEFLAAEKELLIWGKLLFLLLVGYILGLLLATWSSEGTYLVDYLYGQSQVPGRWWWLLPRLGAYLFGILHWFPRPVHNFIVQADLDIANDLFRQSGINTSYRQSEPRALYRAVMTDKLGAPGKTILDFADAAQRRFLFCQGIALVGALLAIQVLIRVLIRALGPPEWDDTFTAVPPAVLVLLGIFGLAVNLGLRWGARGPWEAELLLTFSLLKVHEPCSRKERITLRAFQKWHARQTAGQAGSAAQDWQEAEQEILKEEC